MPREVFLQGAQNEADDTVVACVRRADRFIGKRGTECGIIRINAAHRKQDRLQQDKLAPCQAFRHLVVFALLFGRAV